MNDTATEPVEERVVDDSYTAVFSLSRQQLASHVADVDGEIQLDNAYDDYGLGNIRVSLDDTDNIVVDSTNSLMVLRVKEQSAKLKDLPLSINPSETDRVILTGPIYIPGAVVNKLVKALPQRKNTSAEPWQREVVFSYTQDGKIEVGYADKQGNPYLDIIDGIEEDKKKFPPIDNVWPPVKPTLRCGFQVNLLKKMVDSLIENEIETVALEFFEREAGDIDYDQGRAMKFYGVEPRPGKELPREVTGIIMPFNVK